MSRLITKKQKAFADEYKETGNATQSALKAYDTKTPEAAKSIGSRTLKIANVQEYLKSKQDVYISRMDKLSTKAKQEGIRYQATKDLLDRSGLKPTEKITADIKSTNVNEDDFNQFLTILTRTTP